MSNDLIWWFHRRSGITMFLSTFSKRLHNHFCSRWDAGSGQPQTSPETQISWKLATRHEREHKSKREPRWDWSKEPEVSSNIRNQAESTAKTRCASGFQCCPSRPHCESKTSCPSAWNLPVLPGLTLPRSFPVRKSVFCLLHCKM